MRLLSSALILCILCCGLTAEALPPSNSLQAAGLSTDDRIVKKIDDVLQVMQELFLSMQNVAKWKWNHKSPIEEDERERAIVEKLVLKGINFGLPSEIVKEIFQAQFEAMRMIQINYFENWKRDGVDQFADVQDYKTELKPRIERMYENLIIQLKEVMPLLRKKNLSEVIKLRSNVILADESIEGAVRDIALQPLLMLCAQITMVQ